MPVAAPVRPATPASPRYRPSWRQGLVAVAVLALVGVVVALPLARNDQPPPAPLDTSRLVPQIEPADGTEVIPTRLDPVPAAGSVLRIPGPFDDETRLDELAMTPGSAPQLTGTVQVVRDVSTLLLLELQAAWYDASGVLLDTDRLVLRQPDFTRAFERGETASMFNGVLPFALAPPPEIADQVASAGINLAVLVNE